MDSFAPYKNTRITKIPSSQAAYSKYLAEEGKRYKLKHKLKRQNIVTSIIPSSGTGYVQPLNISINKLLKGLIRS